MKLSFGGLLLALVVAGSNLVSAEEVYKTPGSLDWMTLNAELKATATLRDESSVSNACEGLFNRVHSADVGRIGTGVLVSVLQNYLALSPSAAVKDNPQWVRLGTVLMDAGFAKLNGLAPELRKDDPVAWGLFGALAKMVEHFFQDVEANGGPNAASQLMKLRPLMSSIDPRSPALVEAERVAEANWQNAKPVIQKLGYLRHALGEAQCDFKFLRSHLYSTMSDAELSVLLKQHGFTERAAALFSASHYGVDAGAGK